MSEIITQQEAKSKGLKHYFTGKPCKRGHTCRRYVSDGECVECKALRNKLAGDKECPVKKKARQKKSYWEKQFKKYEKHEESNLRNVKRMYKITDKDGKVTITESLNAFANEVDIYYGQFYTALHGGHKTRKGGYKVEWFSPEKDTSSKPKFKITDPIGIVHEVDSYKEFADSIGVNIHGFKKVLQGKQKQCYGGYTICYNNKPVSEEDKTVVEDYATNQESVASSNTLQIIDVIREGNVHKVKFSTPKGNVHTRKVEIKRVNNMYGVKCDYSGINIPMGQLYATCNNGSESYIFSVDQIKSLGYEFNIDFDFNTKITEKKVEVFTPERLEEVWLEKMDKVTKEITAVQKKLSQLKEAKEYIGQSLSQTKAMNERLSVADKYLSKLL